MILLTKSEFRKIWINLLRKSEDFKIKRTIYGCLDDELRVSIEYDNKHIEISDSRYHGVLNINDIYKYTKKSIVVFVDENGIIEGKLEYMKSIYELVYNGELDYLNLIINGKKVFDKKYPIKHCIKTITKYIGTDFDSIGVFGSAMGYLLNELSSNDIDITFYEWDKGIIAISKYNPCSSKFIEYINSKQDALIIDSLINLLRYIDNSTYNIVVYNPPTFYKDTTNFYSRKILSVLSNSIDKEGSLIISLNKPKKMSLTYMYNSIINKIGKTFKDVKVIHKCGLMFFERKK